MTTAPILRKNESAGQRWSNSAITFGGSVIAFAKVHGIDTTSLASSDQYTEVTDPDGAVWNVRKDQWLIHAYRERTAEELVQWNDEVSAHRFSSWFSSDRLRICAKIANEVMDIAWHMKPDAPFTRSQRRKLKLRLGAMACVQFELTHHAEVDMASIRDRLAKIDFEVAQVDHRAEIAAS